MTCTCEAWADWIACENEYARGDRAVVKAGALDYLNTIAVANASSVSLKPEFLLKQLCEIGFRLGGFRQQLVFAIAA